MKNDFKIVLQCLKVSGSSASFAAGPWQIPSGGSMGKGLSVFTSVGSIMA